MESLIAIKQLPVIEEHLRTLKDRWEQRALDAENMVCTEDTIQAIKAFRAEMNKEFEDVESRRKAVKNAVMGPYNAFEATYKDCITDAYRRAYAALTVKINKVELDIKTRCEDGLREYFAELCAAYHLDWLTYERAVELGFKVDMASAKAKTPKKLREQLKEFVERVARGVEAISGLDNANEIMVEFMRTLDAMEATVIVRERYQRIEEQKAAQEARKAEQERESEMVRRVEALAPPEPVVKCTFTVRATKAQLRKLREFLNMEGIEYE